MNNFLVKISRIAMISMSILMILILLAASIWEKAGGGSEKLKYALLPLILILILNSMVFGVNAFDKDIKIINKKALIRIEVILGIVYLLFIAISIFSMISYQFNIQWFIFLLLLELPPLLIIINFWKNQKNTS